MYDFYHDVSYAILYTILPVDCKNGYLLNLKPSNLIFLFIYNCLAHKHLPS